MDDTFQLGGFSVQYATLLQPQMLSFLNCKVAIVKDEEFSMLKTDCCGAKAEKILFYPSINNVVVGGKKSYEVSTTLCPGKPSCLGKYMKECNLVDLLLYGTRNIG